MRRFLILAATLALGLSTAAGADVNWSRINLSQERAAIENYQAFDQRLQDVGWKMVRGNAEFCEKVIPSIGLQLQDLASYGAPEVARRALSMEGDFAVQTAATGSPSGETGAFASNREVTMIGALLPNSWPAEERLHWERLTRAHDTIDEALALEGMLSFGFADGGFVEVEPVPACATRFELAGGTSRAVADGDRVVIGIKFPGFAYEEEVFAGVVAHELAHNLLGHSAWLDRNGRGRRNVRKTEKEADRLMPWIMANAGYDPIYAQRFMEAWGPRHDGGLFRNRSHDGWDERAEFIAAELPKIRELMASAGKADWRTHFEREIDPMQGLEQQD